MRSQYLERLFTWESLENSERRVEFELKNRLTGATFSGTTAAQLNGDPVDLSNAAVELPDGIHIPVADITDDDPLEFGLDDTAQILLDRERLTLGTHGPEIDIDVDRVGAVSFDVTDGITEADLLDADSADYTAAGLRTLVADLSEPAELERLLELEQDGKDRKTARAAIEDRLEAARAASPESAREADSPHRDRSAVFGGTLADLVMDGVVKRTERGYRAKPPLSVLQRRSKSVFDAFGLGLGYRPGPSAHRPPPRPDVAFYPARTLAGCSATPRGVRRDPVGSRDATLDGPPGYRALLLGGLRTPGRWRCSCGCRRQRVPDSHRRGHHRPRRRRADTLGPVRDTEHHLPHRCRRVPRTGGTGCRHPELLRQRVTRHRRSLGRHHRLRGGVPPPPRETPGDAQRNH
jgi:hypothetical protein